MILNKLTANEDDERYRYLLRHGIVRRVEDEDKIIFAELKQIPGVLVVYRKPSERNLHHDKLMLNKRELSHLPLLEGEERLRLLNLQSNQISKIENLVSLPTLVWLDLNWNKIAEIENLHTVPSLRMLFLGKNCITRIRGLDSLKYLEMIDLHSNKISKIENLKHLTNLKSLNLSNNQISVVDSLTGWVSLNKLLLSQNRIVSEENIKNIKNIKTLGELSLEGNPIAINIKAYVRFCFTKFLSLKILDGKRESEYKESKGFSLEDAKSGTESTQPTPDKKGDPNDDDISPEKLLKVISQEWTNEMKRLQEKGLNGYKRRKDSKQETWVQSGHAEIEGNTMLFIYGNAIEVLEKSNFQKEVEEITFQYMRFNTIVGGSNMKKLKKFDKLRKLTFMDNNIHSFVQISKLEAITTLRSLSIVRNDVHSTSLWRWFIVYRFPGVTEINGMPVTEEEKLEAKTQFQNFDKILSTQRFYPARVAQERSRDESSGSHHSERNTKQFMKKNNEAAHDYVNNLLNTCIKQDRMMSGFHNDWDNIMKGYVSKAVEELNSNNEKENQLKAK